MHFKHSANIFFYRKSSKNRGFLRQIPNPQTRTAIHRQVRDVGAIHNNLPVIGANQSGDHVKARVKGLRNRRSFWESTLRGPIGQAVLDGNQQQAEQQLIASIKQEIAPPSGEIVFIHTKNGNPDHLTLNAHRAMQFADAVFYDDDVNIELIDYVRRDAEKFLQTINSTILVNYQHATELAKQGQKVIYLLPGNEPLPHNSALQNSKVTIKEIICGA